MHRVIRTIRGRQYEYEEESYRVPGEKNPRKRSRYIGPVNPEPEFDEFGRRKKKGVAKFISDLVRSRAAWEETEEEEKKRAAEMTKQDAVARRNNELLAGRSIKLEEIKEIAASQRASAPEPSPSEPSAATEDRGASGDVDTSEAGE